jgi:hypothetical protein
MKYMQWPISKYSASLQASCIATKNKITSWLAWYYAAKNLWYNVQPFYDITFMEYGIWNIEWILWYFLIFSCFH